jgi:GTP-binding protein
MPGLKFHESGTISTGSARHYRGFDGHVPAYPGKEMTSGQIKHNPYRSANYVISAHNLKQLPEDSGLEVAFAGRSNAGKSSAINALTDQKSLARTSKTPGRTQQIVIFDIDEQRRIADLPGYGYAKVPERLRAHWRHVMQIYFNRRQSLRGVVLVMDIRHPLRPFDEQMLNWCEGSSVPCHVLLTKADKLKRGPAQATLLKVRKSLPFGATAQVFSASRRMGLDELISILNGWYRIGYSGAAERPESSGGEKSG